MVRPDVLYCGNVAILGKQNIRFDCRAKELLYARVPGGADECRISPPAAAHRGQNPGASKVKLPMLVIAKFNGTFTDWFRFWNQYEAEIDSPHISPVSKFSYLKELVITLVRANIDALPLTSEGYEKAMKANPKGQICETKSLPVLWWDQPQTK